MSGGRIHRGALIVAGAVALAAGAARGDRIVLRGGGSLTGVVLPGEGQPDQVVVLTEALARPVTLRKASVAKVVPGPTPLHEYLDRKARAEATAQAEYDLGLWCEGQGLADLAEVHFQRAIERDAEFAPAHEKLGHTLRDGRWLTADELREAQGLVKVKGRWVSPQEKARLDARAAFSAEQASWARRLQVLRQALLTGSPERQEEARGQLEAIDDPAAVVPLVRAFGGDAPAVRTMLDGILAAIPGPEAAAALVGRLLGEDDDGVRTATAGELARRPEAEVIPELVRALKSRDLRVLNRAAWALGELGASAAVPRLIPALVVVEQRVVWVPTGGSGLMSAPAFASGISVPIPVLTPPAVAPGAIAFGATSVPYGFGSGLALGGGSSRPVPQIYRQDHYNVEVLRALRRLTGQDFGYDIAAWRRWLAAAFRPAPAAPARRVPQP